MRSINYPFTHQEVKDLPMGFTASATYLGFRTDELGRNVQGFAPTRRQRRAVLHKANNRKHFGKHVRLQYVDGKVIRHLRNPLSNER